MINFANTYLNLHWISCSRVQRYLLVWSSLDLLLWYVACWWCRAKSRENCCYNIRRSSWGDFSGYMFVICKKFEEETWRYELYYILSVTFIVIHTFCSYWYLCIDSLIYSFCITILLNRLLTEEYDFWEGKTILFDALFLHVWLMDEGWKFCGK